MPCCGPWRARHVCSSMLWPILIGLVANVMWVTTSLSGPFLPPDKIRTVIQQIVTPIVMFGISSVGWKVAAGAKWKTARSKNGVQLVDLLGRSGGTDIRHASGMRERFVYVLLALASFASVLMNLGHSDQVLVPAFWNPIQTEVFIPSTNATHNVTATFWVSNDDVVQPSNLVNYVNDQGLSNITFSPALLAFSALAYNSSTVVDADLPAAEIEVPAVLFFAQNFDADYFLNDESWGWGEPLARQSGDYLVELGYTSDSKTEILQLCMRPFDITSSEVLKQRACIFFRWQVVLASVAYDVNGRILGSTILKRLPGVDPYAFADLNASSFSDYFTLGWSREEGRSLLIQTLYNELAYEGFLLDTRVRFGIYRPATPFTITGIAAYVGASMVILLFLCFRLAVLDPKEAMESSGLVTLSRWPAELAAKVYGTQESLSKAGKKRVFLHETGPQEWVLSSEKAVPPAVVQLPYQTGPQLPYQPQDMVEKPPRLPRPSMPKRLSSSSSKRHSDSYRVSRPSYSSRPSYQSRPSYHSKSSYSPPRLSPRPSSSPVPGSGSRPGYPSRPSYSSRPSYHSRPSSSSRDRPSLSRSRSQGQEEYFESEEGPEMYEGRWGVHDIR